MTQIPITKPKVRQCTCCGIIEHGDCCNEELKGHGRSLLCNDCIRLLNQYSEYYNYSFTISQLSSIDRFENTLITIKERNNA